MRNILFVDDEPRVLDGLVRAMRPRRAEWRAVPAVGARAALALLAREPFDVIVTDMRMPEMDGAALLERVKADHPEVVRVVLSGHTEVEAALRLVHVAQQFLSKPCSAETLHGVIGRACGLLDLLSDPQLREMVGRIDKLPSASVVLRQLEVALARDDVSLAEVARLVERDMAMCAKVLQLVNSAFFGLSTRLTGIDAAVAYLGTEMLQNLVFSMEVFSVVRAREALPEAEVARLQAHSFSVASLAQKVLPEERCAADLFVAGMLHDVGQLVLAARQPAQFAAARAQAAEYQQPLEVIEAEQGRFTHAHVGAYLLGVWGLPVAVVEAVAQHHDAPPLAPSAGGARVALDVVRATQLAEALMDAAERERDRRPPVTAPVLSPAHLRALGVEEKLPAWQSLARALAARS